MKVNKSIQNKTLSHSEIPIDVLLGIPIINIIGDQELEIENHKGIIVYTDTLIKIKTKIGQLKIVGNRLQINNYSNDDIKISGSIHSVNINS